MTFEVGRPVRGTVRVPGDKSISHRAAVLASLALGPSSISNYCPAGDCTVMLNVLRALGAGVEVRGDTVVVTPPPEPARAAGPLDCARSGTTMRLLAGLLAGMPFRSTLTGHEQLLRRPMGRVAAPLRLMGAEVELADGEHPPLSLRGGSLVGIEYELPVASAQVKSAVLLAGLSALGATTVVEPVRTRDHTERLMGWLGASVHATQGRVTVRKGEGLRAFELRVPGDLSSAAPMLAAAALVPGSDLVVDEVGLNPTRTGLIRALERMGASIEIEALPSDPEPGGRLRIRHGPLVGTAITADEIPTMVDELPLLGVLATQAEGVTEVRGAEELRVKESDRIAGLVTGLRILGADVEEFDDGFAVRGPTPLRGGAVDSRSDHRLAMAFAVASLVIPEHVQVSDMGFVADSFPGFLRALESVR
jgi:3-phosphoshikimate 1-carboxyvinyltransferase